MIHIYTLGETKGIFPNIPRSEYAGTWQTLMKDFWVCAAVTSVFFHPRRISSSETEDKARVPALYSSLDITHSSWFHRRMRHNGCSCSWDDLNKNNRWNQISRVELPSYIWYLYSDLHFLEKRHSAATRCKYTSRGPKGCHSPLSDDLVAQRNIFIEPVLFNGIGLRPKIPVGI